MHNPYRILPDRAFWKPAVSSRDIFSITDLWKPKFPICKTDTIATYGSCFAQRIGEALSKNMYNWIDAEPAPLCVSDQLKEKYSYGIFSSRTGNIYTASLLLQWTRWALSIETPPNEFWEKDGRFFDPFRPQIEPNGFASVEEMKLSRQQAIESFRDSFTEADIFIFTLGLTESWGHAELGYEYPICPGTVAGEYNPDLHVFINQGFEYICQSLTKAFDLMRAANPLVKFILTVSPVPLVATNSGQHVLVATTSSKSILRACAEHMVQTANLKSPECTEVEVRLINNAAPTFRCTSKIWHKMWGNNAKENGFEIEHLTHFKSSFSGMRIQLSNDAKNGDVFKFAIQGNVEKAGVINAHCSPRFNNTQGATLIGKANQVGPYSFEIEVEVNWSGDVYLWIGSREYETKFDIASCFVSRKIAVLKNNFIDYFPSYELINSPVFKGVWFARNERSISKAGVDHVMSHFFSSINGDKNVHDDDLLLKTYDSAASERDICDEMILETFAK